MASNSLLEALVFAENAYCYCKENWGDMKLIKQSGSEKWEKGRGEALDEEIVVNHNWDVIRRIMWDYVGIVRKTSRLEIAKQKIGVLKGEIDEILETYRITPNMLELSNITLVASLIIEASLQREESRGLHYILDYPSKDRGQKKWNVFYKDKLNNPEERIVR